MPELKIDLDDDGRVTGAHLAKNTESHQIIEEFMLAANEAVAEKLRRRGPDLPAPRARQPRSAEAARRSPSSSRELGFKVESLENRFELQKLLDDGEGRPARACRQLRGAALDAAGRLQPRGGRPLRPGQRLLLPLHVADSPLSRT